MPPITFDPTVSRLTARRSSPRRLVLVTATTRAPPGWQLHPNMAADPDAAPSERPRHDDAAMAAVSDPPPASTVIRLPDRTDSRPLHRR